MRRLSKEGWIRFFASVEWSLFALRTGILVVWTCILGLWIHGTGKSNPLKSLFHQAAEHYYSIPGITRAAIICLLTGLILIHLWVSIRHRNSRGMRFAGLNASFLILICLPLLTGVDRLFSQSLSRYVTPGRVYSYLEKDEEYELAVIQDLYSGKDGVYSLDWHRLESGQPIKHPDWPFRILVLGNFRNAVFAAADTRIIDLSGKRLRGIRADSGTAAEQDLRLFPNPRPAAPPAPGAWIQIVEHTGETTGSLLVGTGKNRRIPIQPVPGMNGEWKVELRPKRKYLDGQFQIKLHPDPSRPLWVFRSSNGNEIEAPVDASRGFVFDGMIFRLFPVSPVDSIALPTFQLVGRSRFGLGQDLALLCLGIAWVIHFSLQFYGVSRKEDSLV